MYEEHLKTCEYCQKGSVNYSKVYGHKPTIRIKSASAYSKDRKPTIFVKSASSYRKERKLTELGAIIKRASYLPVSVPVSRTKGASKAEVAARRPGPIEREIKLRELGKLIRG